ncbi:MAG: hypothetical protein WC082_10800 [Victivallales bacterium]|nr:hypothetical protein [Desulfobacterales bacterium]MDD3951781.1 hypothetical protein [Desulfobacterales bacterium]MDD4464583.1 hypothetical protein [Desulfobacterales bacterium]
MKNNLKGLILVGVFLGVFICGTAVADIISFDLTIGNEALSSGPWAAVEVNQSNDEAVITVTSYDNCLINSIGINPNGYTGYSNLTPGFSTKAISGSSNPLHPKNMSEFGRYSLIFRTIPPNAVDTLSFTLTGTGWSSAADVLAFNDKGYLAASHVCISDGTGNTGFASAAPIPAAVWLLGFGVVGLVGAKKRIS